MFIHCHLPSSRIISSMVFPLWLPFENEWMTFFALLLVILILIFLSDLFLNKNLLSADSCRRLVHLQIGLLIASSPMFFSSNIQPASLSIIFIILNTFFHKKKYFNGIHSQKRITYGTTYFPIAYLVLILAFWNYHEFIIMSLSILAISDPFAAHVGENTVSPKPFTVWNDKKTIKGTLAFFICTFVILYAESQILFNYTNIYLIFFSIFVSIGAFLAEITSSKGSDNLSIPIVSFLFMVGFIEIFDHHTDLSLQLKHFSKIATILFMVLVFYFSYKTKALSLSGIFGAFIMGVIIVTLGSNTYLIPIAIFFILSSILSKILKNKSFCRTKGSKRDVIQVYANGGVGLFICILDYFYPNPVYNYVFISSIASAMSDTWGTEFGKLSRQKPISITSWKTIEHGLSGGITRIGTIGALLGSSIMGLVTSLMFDADITIIYAVIFIGFFGAIFDSVLGDTLQAKFKNQSGDILENPSKDYFLSSGIKFVNNDLVNLLTTLITPILMFLYLAFTK